MRLSYAIEKGITKALAGALLNSFVLKKRRSTLFFEDFLAKYFQACEKSGSQDKLRSISEEWMYLGVSVLFPSPLRVFSVENIANDFLKPLWKTSGLFSDARITVKDSLVLVETEDECISRLVGKNVFMPGVLEGVFGALMKQRVRCTKASQTLAKCSYELEATGKAFSPRSKSKQEYDSLNRIPFKAGFSLQDALRTRLLRLREGNRLFFRSHPVWYVENTLFHLLGQERLAFKKIPGLARDFFAGTLYKSSLDERLVLYKNLLQVMGWGIPVFSTEKNEITLVLQYPPHGLQAQPGSWEFLALFTEGFLQSEDPAFRLGRRVEKKNEAVFTFARA